MNLEIEKKYLFKKLPNIGYDEIYKITQYYWNNPETGIWERWRKRVNSNKDVEYFYTVKNFVNVDSRLVAEEFEEVISEADFKEQISKCTLKLDKVRYVWNDGSLTWEIDKFKNMDLVVGEVELPNVEYEVVIPTKLSKYLLIDVTEYKEFSSRRLSKKIKVKV